MMKGFYSMKNLLITTTSASSKTRHGFIQLRISKNMLLKEQMAPFR